MFNLLLKFPFNNPIGSMLFALFLLQHANYALSESLNTHQVTELIKKADNYRLSKQSAKIVSKVTLYKNLEIDKTRLYRVYTRENRESLVLFDSPVEAGQKMLMLGDNYWLLMPKSRRPIRITPMQKLLGEASIGDISTLTWSENYTGKWIKQEQLSVSDAAGNTQVVDTELLKLSAKTKGASYFTIDLWLQKHSSFPIKADLYLRSGKLAKQAWFTKGLRDGKQQVISMRLVDKIQKNQQTLIEYKQITALEIDNKYYNPAYLSRTKKLSL